jgi:putative SOS response-associated peptidase YedK
MCGRYQLAVRKERVCSLFDVVEAVTPEGVAIFERYNIAPTQPAAVIRQGPRGRILEPMRWGLVPHWSKEPTTRYATFNARSEDAAEKPTYRGPMRYRRGIVPLCGFYEWRKSKGGKQPHHIRLADEQPFALAGLWDVWGGELQTFSILTTTPNEMLAQIHNRMPVILDAADYDRWLDPGLQDPAQVADLLRPFPAERMLATPVTDYVNNARHEGPDCLRPETLWG